MSASVIISSALAGVAAMSVVGYVYAVSRGRRISDDLLTLAVVCVIASCTVAPK